MDDATADKMGYLIQTSSYTNAYIVKVVKEAFPEQYQGPPALQPEDADLSISRAYTLNATYSNGKMKLQHTDLRQTIIDTAQALYDVQRKLQSEAMV